jgi:hypothetical protein
MAWVTVVGGALLGTAWTWFGGLRARGPDDELVPGGAAGRPDERRVTRFTSAQVGIHGFLGLLTASLATYAAAFDGDRRPAYIAVLIALAVTAAPGSSMFLKWRSGRRAPTTTSTSSTASNVEARLPSPLVYLHGVVVMTTAALFVVLLLVD